MWHSTIPFGHEKSVLGKTSGVSSRATPSSTERELLGLGGAPSDSEWPYTAGTFENAMLLGGREDFSSVGRLN
jgi:hypothetical protein